MVNVPEVALVLMTSSRPKLDVVPGILIWVNETDWFAAPGLWISVITPPSPLEKMRSPFGAIFSESGSVCGTTSILPVTVLRPIDAVVRIG